MACICLLGAGLLACSEARRAGPNTVPVTVTRAEARDVPFEITTPGTVEPIQAVDVTSQVTGVVTAVRFREGDEVRAGQVLVELDQRSYRNALRQAEASLARDLAQLENARRQVERYRGLARSEFVSSEQFEALSTTAQALEATVKADSAALDDARLDLEYTVIRAPISGRTGSLLIKEGNLVRAQGSGPLVMVNQTRPILVRFAVPASYFPLVRRYGGKPLPVLARPGDSTTVLEGVLTFVDNVVDTTTGTIMLKARFPNNLDMLWPGQFVTATLRLFEEPGVVVIPVPAVVESEGGTYVYVIGPDTTAATRPIVVGRTVEEFVIVAEGLDPGELVVTDGQLRLVPGARVSIRQTIN